MNNPIQLLKVLMSKNKNPQEIAMQLIGNNNNPVINNLVQMAKKRRQTRHRKFCKKCTKRTRERF